MEYRLFRYSNYLELNNTDNEKISKYFLSKDENCVNTKRKNLLIPLFSPRDNSPQALCIFHLTKDVDISTELDQMIGQLSVPLSVTIEREAVYRTLELERDKIYKRSIRDTLTSLYTRSYMHDSVERLLNIHNRDANAYIVLVICDIDHFKRINDTYGHVVGDKVLKTVGHIVLDEVRSTDIPVRFGGEEFAIFMPVQMVETGTNLAERLRQKIEKIGFSGVDKKYKLSVTISAGVAIHHQNESLQELIHRADEKMYQAKESGRNQVCVAN